MRGEPLEVHRPQRRRSWRSWLLAAGALLLAWVTVGSLRAGSAPRVEIAPEVPGIGRRTPVTVSLAADGRGLARARVALVQGERSYVLAERSWQPRAAAAFWGARTLADELELEVGLETVSGPLEEGSAVLRVEAWPPGTWLRRPPPVVEELELPVLLRPPAAAIVSDLHYPAQGGSEVVVYRVGPTAVEDGVRVGELWYPGARLPGGSEADRFALFGVPFDLEDSRAIELEVADVVGNRTRHQFVDRFFPRAFRTDDIRVSDEFMAKVVPEIFAQTPAIRPSGNPVEDYVRINSELRRANAARLVELAAESPAEFLWREVFLPMPNAQVMSSFADRRTYLYDERVIDHQDHLGFDLASVSRAPVPAANRGVVTLAEYFGIYGNAVVVDHGFGLASLYGHLSSIAVTVGEEVERGEALGRTGETGLAAGDHLHFTMLLRGRPVTPVEWWDAGWIRDRLKRKLGPSLPFGS